MIEGEFDEAALNRLLQEALAPPTLPEPERRAPLPVTLLNTQIFEHVAAILRDRLPAPDATQALDELRSRLYEGIDRGDITHLHAMVRACRKCDSVEEGQTPCLPVGNLVEPDLLVVHELPVRGMSVEGRFMELLREAGFAQARVAHTSAIRCDPAQARQPNATELSNCRRYLHAELPLLQPKLVLTLGTTALSTLLAGSPVAITKERGHVFWLGPWPILPTYAMGYVMKRAEAKEDILADLRKAYEFIYG